MKNIIMLLAALALMGYVHESEYQYKFEGEYHAKHA